MWVLPQPLDMKSLLTVALHPTLQAVWLQFSWNTQDFHLSALYILWYEIPPSTIPTLLAWHHVEMACKMLVVFKEFAFKTKIILLRTEEWVPLYLNSSSPIWGFLFPLVSPPRGLTLRGQPGCPESELLHFFSHYLFLSPVKSRTFNTFKEERKRTKKLLFSFNLQILSVPFSFWCPVFVKKEWKFVGCLAGSVVECLS